jgi:uncharacterized membrane protein (UPF0127 family)
MLVNRTTAETLARSVFQCDTFWRRLRGLMLRPRLTTDEAYLFTFPSESAAAASVHMMFVFFPIALVWLDRCQRVVDTRLARPFRLWYAPRRPAKYLIEGAPELLDLVKVGDELEF